MTQFLSEINEQGEALGRLADFYGGEGAALLAQAGKLIQAAHGALTFTGMGTSWFAPEIIRERVARGAHRHLVVLDAGEFLHYGLDAVRDHERELTRYALEVLPREVPGIEIYGPAAEHRGGVVSFNLPGIHPHDVAQILDRSGICIRAGHHCTMPLHERFDLAASARASFNVYTIPEEIDALAVGLREVARIFDR